MCVLGRGWLTGKQLLEGVSSERRPNENGDGLSSGRQQPSSMFAFRVDLSFG